MAQHNGCGRVEGFIQPKLCETHFRETKVLEPARGLYKYEEKACFGTLQGAKPKPWLVA
jgi:hypothetical protein